VCVALAGWFFLDFLKSSVRRKRKSPLFHFLFVIWKGLTTIKSLDLIRNKLEGKIKRRFISNPYTLPKPFREEKSPTFFPPKKSNLLATCEECFCLFNKKWLQRWLLFFEDMYLISISTFCRSAFRTRAKQTNTATRRWPPSSAVRTMAASKACLIFWVIHGRPPVVMLSVKC
jgi:hypothetical protein